MTRATNSPSRSANSGRSGHYIVLRRDVDGRLYDCDRQRLIELDQLADYIRAGTRFRVYRECSGYDCTVEVLVELVCSILPVFDFAPSGYGPPLRSRRTDRAARKEACSDRPAR